MQHVQVHVSVGGVFSCCFKRYPIFIAIAVLLRFCLRSACTQLVSQSGQWKMSGRSCSSSRVVQEMCNHVKHELHWIFGVLSLLFCSLSPQRHLFGGVSTSVWTVSCVPFRRLFGDAGSLIDLNLLRAFFGLCMFSMLCLKMSFCFSCLSFLSRMAVARGITSSSLLYLYHHWRARNGSILFLSSHSCAKKLKSCKAIFFVSVLYFLEPLSPLTNA